mmetsp:Transcript_78707/g.218649  ORF Transcript_78707/g.218649 Transcript_78707/m.218649 type:complete len:277 (+) Transcript_78707:380-1210(+)
MSKLSAVVVACGLVPPPAAMALPLWPRSRCGGTCFRRAVARGTIPHRMAQRLRRCSASLAPPPARRRRCCPGISGAEQPRRPAVAREALWANCARIGQMHERAAITSGPLPEALTTKSRIRASLLAGPQRQVPALGAACECHAMAAGLQTRHPDRAGAGPRMWVRRTVALELQTGRSSRARRHSSRLRQEMRRHLLTEPPRHIARGLRVALGMVVSATVTKVTRARSSAPTFGARSRRFRDIARLEVRNRRRSQAAATGASDCPRRGRQCLCSPDE